VWARAIRPRGSTVNSAGRRKKNLYLIDTTPPKAGFKVGEGATTLAGDGVHPSQYGNALLGAFIAVEAQKALNSAQ
jgi:hypothetical protein